MEKIILDKIRKSNQSIKAAILLIENGFYNEAINRIYYSCFHLVSGLLLVNNIDAKTHNGVKTMFHKTYGQNNLIEENLAVFYSSLFFYRHSSDYDDEIEYEKEVVTALYYEALNFIKAINELLTLP